MSETKQIIKDLQVDAVRSCDGAIEHIELQEAELARLRDELQDIRQAVDGDTSPTHTSLIDQIGTLRNEARRSADAWAELARYKAEHELLYRDICGGDWTVGKLAVGLSQLKTEAEAGRRLRGLCPACGGVGWTTESEHHPNCDGSCTHCPIPVQAECNCEAHIEAALNASESDGCGAEGEGDGG